MISIEGGFTATGQVVHRIYATVKYPYHWMSVCVSDSIDLVIPVDIDTTDLDLCKRCFKGVVFK